jgi:4-hydroxythreonine-4-phosphate dehydrogenase
VRRVTRLAVTIGDPAGIGPEIILKAALQLPADVELVVYGERDVLDATAQSVPDLNVFEGGVVDVGSPIDCLEFGSASEQGARLQYKALIGAVDAALNGDVAAVVTAPWTKHILPLAGIPASGHTEVIASRCGAGQPTMMLCGDVLRVALATIHVPLRQVGELLTIEGILGHLKTLDRDLRTHFGIAQPSIAVCGLNPHAGEGGIMGDEEQRVIEPAVLKANELGIHAEGPFPGDTIFARAVRQRSWDVVLAMYHDQGLAPLKLWHFGEAVNVTLGLPIIRTSPDHGTAYDIAGRGVADPSSMKQAIELAYRMVAARIQ